MKVLLILVMLAISFTYFCNGATTKAATTKAATKAVTAKCLTSGTVVSMKNVMLNKCSDK